MSAAMAIQKWKKRHAGILMLSVLTKKLLRVINSLVPSRGTDHNVFEFDHEDVEETKLVPKDVKEGHFAVIAAKSGKQKRFIVDLSYLRSPEFLGLLEMAREEYGFQQENVLVIPCQPEDLQKILEGSTKIN